MRLQAQLIHGPGGIVMGMAALGAAYGTSASFRGGSERHTPQRPCDVGCGPRCVQAGTQQLRAHGRMGWSYLINCSQKRLHLLHCIGIGQFSADGGTWGAHQSGSVLLCLGGPPIVFKPCWTLHAAEQKRDLHDWVVTSQR